jgi:hypothetical protein
MAKTRTEAIGAILQDLGVLDRGGNVSTADSARVQTRYDAGITMLSNEDIITVSDPVAGVPDNVFLPLVDWLVEYCRPSFYQQRNEEAWGRARKHLRRISRLSYTVGDTIAEQLAARILRGINYIAPDEAPSPAEVTLVTEKITAAIVDLQKRQVIDLGDVESVLDLGAFDAFADYMVAVLRPQFSQDSQVGRLGPASIIGRQDAERRLRSIAAAEPTYGPLIASYF